MLRRRLWGFLRLLLLVRRFRRGDGPFDLCCGLGRWRWPGIDRGLLAWRLLGL